MKKRNLILLQRPINMNNTLNLTIFIVSTLNVLASAPDCKTLKSCATWASDKTGINYQLGNLEKRSLKLEKDFNLEEGNPDLLFSFILNQNEYIRIKRDPRHYDIIPQRELKNFTFPKIKFEQVLANSDYITMEFQFASKAQTKNIITILKKFISKNGNATEIPDENKVIITETGYQMIAIKSLIDHFLK